MGTWERLEEQTLSNAASAALPVETLLSLCPRLSLYHYFSLLLSLCWSLYRSLSPSLFWSLYHSLSGEEQCLTGGFFFCPQPGSAVRQSSSSQWTRDTTEEEHKVNTLMDSDAL